ncbi:host cell division inhibitor Icd-like protein [Rouxiella badensis]|uniref:Host cell division inhibitor Icd-like protein n=2 Tax=Yersiniaceae TaxID=1903411 RepID=A0AA40X382_9GAMM|nr:MULTISPECIES: host cell division inhibitor Icd-like protein [Rouxiella]MBF6637880.1 host cell division inhibitor Icd-like protein [Rouxiella silvae]KAB7898861.1 host cell division inhibitor Icd-like protein [Rouxiella sp. S1S-2]MCC3705201.1 host cell division inhibitor Icd-like protein [Rouxiella badensis]MCC3735478.1 host cell division inhibitor Icd-like protein [Rouxiella badensis]MCC3760775.1 host cell division inhibitor Icd-like protein [Rouxiella badensis]
MNTSTAIYVFASILRSDAKSQPVMRRVTACSEREARSQLARDYVLSLACKLPTLRGSHG